MYQLNRRHNSVLNPTGIMQMQLSNSHMSSSTSNNSSYLQNSNNAPQNKVPQYLQQSSFFPPSELVDNNTSNENTDDIDNINIVKQLTDLVNQTIDSSSDKSEEDDDEDEEDFKQGGQPNFATHLNMDKRKSDGMMLNQLQQFHNFISNKPEEMCYNPNFFTNKVNNMTQNNMKGGNNNPYLLYSNLNYLSPMKTPPWKQGQFNSNNINMNSNLRRYSQINTIPFNLMSNHNYNYNCNLPQNNVNPYKSNHPSQFPISPISIQKGQNSAIQALTFQKQLMDDQFFLQNVLILLKDQTGSRLVQEKLEAKKDNKTFLKQFFTIISNSLAQIINDNFGNYAMQKFIEILINQQQSELITEFFLIIQDDLFNISVDNFGSRFFQKFLSKLSNNNYNLIETPELNEIFKQLIQKHLFSLCYDKNGNHVFQKILAIYPSDKNDFIFEELNKYAIDISKLQQNVVILQTVFKLAQKSQKELLVNTILSKIDQLINDEYGNFLISYIVEQLADDSYVKKVYDYLTNNIIILSQKKYSSNVIDKFIEIPNNHYSLDLIGFIIENQIVKEIIVNEFGNYVIQKALKKAGEKAFQTLIQQIEPMLETLLQLNIGRKIYFSLVQNYGMYFQNSSKLIKNNQIQNTVNSNNNNVNTQSCKNKKAKKAQK